MTVLAFVYDLSRFVSSYWLYDKLEDKGSNNCVMYDDFSHMIYNMVL